MTMTKYENTTSRVCGMAGGIPQVGVRRYSTSRPAAARGGGGVGGLLGWLLLGLALGQGFGAAAAATVGAAAASGSSAPPASSTTPAAESVLSITLTGEVKNDLLTTVRMYQ
jgi:hypothetical protein